MTPIVARSTHESSDAAPRVLADRTQSLAGLRNQHLFLIACVLFLAPNFLLAAEFRGLPGIVTLVGCAVALALLASRRPVPESFLAASIDVESLAGLALLSTSLLLLSGATHLVAPPPDWHVRDAVLADLTLQRFPPLYRYAETEYFLRAPVGMFLAPALVGRSFGLETAHVALLAQNAGLLTLLLYFFVKLADCPKAVFVVVFLGFAWADQVLRIGRELFLGLDPIWNPFRFKYVSTIANLFWAPNHAFPGLWGAALALLAARREVDPATMGLSLVSTWCWSPLGALGATPFLAYAALREGPRALASARSIAAAGAGLCFIPVAFYLSLDAAQTPHRWLLGAAGFAPIWLAFVLVEAPHAGILFAARATIAPCDRAPLILAAFVLVCIPFYSLGPFNDFSMRVPQTALAIVGFSFARVASVTPPARRTLFAAIIVVTLVTALKSLPTLRYPFTAPSYPISDCNLLTAAEAQENFEPPPPGPPMHYLARLSTAPGWLGPLSSARLEDERRKCWPSR